MTHKQLRDQLRAMRRAVAFVQSGRLQQPEHWREETAVGNAVYRAFGQPLIGEETTLANHLVRDRIVEAVKRVSGVDWTQR